MSISEVSQITTLSLDTLRYYEKIGLITDIKRSESGKRNYSDKDLERLNFIMCMKKAGCSLEVIKEYMLLYAKGEVSREERVELLKKQKAILENSVEEIQESIDYLNYKIEYTQKGNIKK